MTKKITHCILTVLALNMLAACTQSTPSMMNQARVELARETSVEQIPLDKVNDKNLSILAEQYRKYGSGPLDITITYDPRSKSYTAMSAVRTLKEVQSTLKKKGVTNLTGETVPVPEGKPSMMVSYDAVTAQAPSGCTPMPGLEINETGRFIGDYKFGCGVETAFAKQIARPSDLEGKSEMGPRPARREAIIVDDYAAGVPRQPLETVERNDLSAE